MKKFVLALLQDPKLYRYLIVGGTCALIDLSAFLLLRNYFAVHYLILATLSFMIATLVNYQLCQRFVFKHQQKLPVKTRFTLTYLVSGVGLAIHHSALLLAIEWLGLHLAAGKIFAMGIAFGWNFLSRKHFVFIPAS